MLISIMNDVTGYKVTSVKSLAGGELEGMTKHLQLGREDVANRMVEEPEARGANAVLAMRFDTSERGGN